jgi:hypothetical protein
MTEASAPIPSTFFAYAGLPALRAETMRDAAATLSTSGHPTKTWEDLQIAGNLIISEICKAIDDAGAVVAEISVLNSNVLFEAGYAIAKNKPIWLAFDETDNFAVKAWKDLQILDMVGRIDYGGSVDAFVSRFSESPPYRLDARLFDSLVSGAKPRESGAIFAPSLPTKFTAATALEKLLERQSHLKILGSGDDLGLAPLQFYVSEIYRSSAAIFHLLRPGRVRADEHNARASFLAGFAHGLEIPVLMVVEDGFQSPLDYKDMVYVYSSSKLLQTYVLEWLNKLPRSAGTSRRGRLALSVELPISNFGQYVAEYESDALTDYFVDTNEFGSILAGGTKVYAGRKGTGKTATMTQAKLELSQDRRNLVVPIKPSSYELTGLVEILQGLHADSSSDYLLMNLWTYLIFTEIALAAVAKGESRPASIGGLTKLQELKTELSALGVDKEDDLSARLESLLMRLDPATRPEGIPEKTFIAEQLRVQHLNRLRVLISQALTDFDRVAVLIDNLDKAWEKGADYHVMGRFILSLLTTTGKIERQFHKSSGTSKSLKVSLTVFLRTDIYDVVATYAREPDKIDVLTVQWDDEELLVRVLEERYQVNRRSKSSSSTDMWDELFPSEVRGLPARDYFLWRTLPRPRDFIYMANATVTTAINRKHPRIQESDVTFAERQYSKFAFDALLVESEAKGFDLEEQLYELAGQNSTLMLTELESLMGPDSPTLVEWLVQTSFFGLETNEGEFTYVEGQTAGRRKRRVAENYAAKEGRGIRLRVHPAFRGYLEIKDDDLHDTSSAKALAR